MQLNIKNIEALSNIEGKDILSMAAEKGILVQVNTSAGIPLYLELDMQKLLEWLHDENEKEDGIFG